MPSNKKVLDWLRDVRLLTVRQPWAWAIVHSTKRIENRSWSTPYRGPLLIHAGKLRSRREYDDSVDYLRKRIGRAWIPAFDEIESGGIVGCAEIVDVLPNGSRPKNKWAQAGAFGWHLARVRSLPFVKLTGRLGLVGLNAAEVRGVAKYLSKVP